MNNSKRDKNIFLTFLPFHTDSEINHMCCERRAVWCFPSAEKRQFSTSSLGTAFFLGEAVKENNRKGREGDSVTGMKYGCTKLKSTNTLDNKHNQSIGALVFESLLY